MKISSDEMNALLYGDDEPQIDRGAVALAIALVALYSFAAGVALGWMVF